MVNWTTETMAHAVGGVPYRGWSVPYCGMGTIIVRSPDGEEIRADSKADNWIDEAWAKLKAAIDERLA